MPGRALVFVVLAMLVTMTVGRPAKGDRVRILDTKNTQGVKNLIGQEVTITADDGSNRPFQINGMNLWLSESDVLAKGERMPTPSERSTDAPSRSAGFSEMKGRKTEDKEVEGGAWTEVRSKKWHNFQMIAIGIVLAACAGFGMLFVSATKAQVSEQPGNLHQQTRLSEETAFEMAAKDTTTAASKDVLVIGAGPSGMAQVNALVGAPGFNVQCFEMNSEIGGLWTWTDDVGDSLGRGSMYRYHQTNGLNEFLELPNYSFVEHFGHLITSYPPRAVMLDYLRGWTKKMGGDKYITVNRNVVSVTYKSDTSKFKVVSQDVKTGFRYLDLFDNVIVCTGHFWLPNYPDMWQDFKGIEDFKGFQIHSNSFRDAQDFRGKKIMMVGNGYSGEDLAMQCVKFGATSATIVYRTEANGFCFEDWPIVEKPLPTHYDAESDEFKFPDGSGVKVDGIMYCTGYKHHFPFLPDELQLITPNRLVPDMLWKGIVHPNNTALTFIGMPDQYYTFTMFFAQAQFVRGLLEGRVQVPPKAEMLADTEAWQKKEDDVHASGSHAAHHQLQLAHTNDAANIVGASMRDDGDLLCQWQDDRHRCLLTYRDCTAKSNVDGTTSLAYCVPWTKMLTDDHIAYLSWCKAFTELSSMQASGRSCL